MELRLGRFNFFKDEKKGEKKEDGVDGKYGREWQVDRASHKVTGDDQ